MRNLMTLLLATLLAGCWTTTMNRTNKTDPNNSFEMAGSWSSEDGANRAYRNYLAEEAMKSNKCVTLLDGPNGPIVINHGPVQSWGCPGAGFMPGVGGALPMSATELGQLENQLLQNGTNPTVITITEDSEETRQKLEKALKKNAAYKRLLERTRQKAAK